MTAFFEYCDQLHKLLLELDEFFMPDDLEELDCDGLNRRIDTVKPCLEDACGVRLVCDEAQDAFFICDLVCWVEVPSNIPAEYITNAASYCALYRARFSYYGGLVSISHTCQTSIDTKGVRQKSACCLEKYGFIYVDNEILTRKYDGKHEYFLENNLTWWDRFFEYE